MELIAAVVVGGALGAILRVWVTDLLQSAPSYATLLVNTVGSFLAGWALSSLDGALLVFVVVGLCGALTTFSTFANEVISHLKNGRRALAVGYAGFTAICCVIAAAIGIFLG